MSIIGTLDSESGRADVLIDGEIVSTIDTFSSAKMPRKSLFSIFNLEHGQHHFTMVVLEERKEDSTGTKINVNAIEVTGVLQVFSE